MKKSYWRRSFVAAFAFVVTLGAFGAAFAQGNKSIFERFGSREPRVCADTNAPARGAITAALAAKYLSCQAEYVSGTGELYLIENLSSVAVGGGVSYAAIMGHRSLAEIDTKHPVYPIRGSFTQYQCINQITAYSGPPGTNCNTYENPKATGYCYRTTFADWRCAMSDTNSGNPANIRHRVPPPKGANGPATTQAAQQPAPAKPKTSTQNAGAKPPAAERDEYGFVKPDFTEMEKYFEIVRYEYDAVGRFNLVIKPKKESNIFKWHLTFYDADGVKVSETTFNGNSVIPTIGEPTKIYSFRPTEKEMQRVTRIAPVWKAD